MRLCMSSAVCSLSWGHGRKPKSEALIMPLCAWLQSWHVVNVVLSLPPLPTTWEAAVCPLPAPLFSCLSQSQAACSLGEVEVGQILYLRSTGGAMNAQPYENLGCQAARWEIL